MYVTPNDVNEYAKAIVNLMDDEVVRGQLGKIGRSRVEDELAWPYQARAYIGVYDRLTRGHTAGNRRIVPGAGD